MSQTILLVDDDAAVRQLLRTILQQAGYRVSEAHDGNEALRHPDLDGAALVITDLMMPEKDGLDVIRKVRQLYPDKKLIAVSGFYGAELLDAARHMGANVVLPKPVGQNELLQAVRDLLDR